MESRHYLVSSSGIESNARASTLQLDESGMSADRLQRCQYPYGRHRYSVSKDVVSGMVIKLWREIKADPFAIHPSPTSLYQSASFGRPALSISVWRHGFALSRTPLILTSCSSMTIAIRSPKPRFYLRPDARGTKYAIQARRQTSNDCGSATRWISEPENTAKACASLPSRKQSPTNCPMVPPN